MNTIDAACAHHAHDDDLQLYILGHLSAAEVDVLERHLSGCPECVGRLAATARFVAHIIDMKRDSSRSDKRAGPRFRTTDAGVLRCLDPLLLERWPIQVVDVSRNGLGLLVPIRLSLGALVQVQVRDAIALGDVRHSTQISEHQFRTGIWIQDLIVTRRIAEAEKSD